MRVALGSIFRNSTDYISRYFDQVYWLADRLAKQGHSLRLILAEGDSVDQTWRLLSERRPTGLDVDLFKRAHGGPSYGSTLHPQRMAQMAWVQNGVLERVMEQDDAFIYVEADLLWQPKTMLCLLSDLSHWTDIPNVVAPLALHHNGRFYDTWAFRKDGQHFGFYPPFHPAIGSAEQTKIDSAGSCLVMGGRVARTCRFQREDCIVGFCRDAVSKGYAIWLDTRVAVIHPPDGSEQSIPGVREAVRA